MQIFLGESLRKVSYRLRAAQLHGQIVNKFHFSCVIFVSLAGGLSFVPCLVCASGSVCLLQDRWKPEKLKKDNAYLHRLIGANIEGYRAIRNAGHKILPDADKEFEGAAWTRKRIPIFSLDLSVCGRNIRGRAMPGTASTPTWWICRPKASAGPSDPIQKQPRGTTKKDIYSKE